jgi:hypothetical protein
LDIPTANTILINHAEKFGLADLHQLRGRVGRGSHQAYAYLLVPGERILSREAMRRLRAIQEMSEMGSGFKLAIRDLEIRGAGNLLGAARVYLKHFYVNLAANIQSSDGAHYGLLFSFLGGVVADHTAKLKLLFITQAVLMLPSGIGGRTLSSTTVHRYLFG